MKLANLSQAVLSWIEQPFNEQGSALNWILFVGLLAIAGWWWERVINSITE